MPTGHDMTLTRLFRLGADHPDIGLVRVADSWWVVANHRDPASSPTLGEGATPGAAIEAAWENAHPTPKPDAAPLGA